jgi:hypothetical protein
VEAAGHGGSAWFAFSDAIQHFEQQLPVASLPKKPQPILQCVVVFVACVWLLS